MDETELNITILEAIKLIASKSGKQISYSVNHHEEPTGLFGTGLRSKAVVKHTVININLTSSELR